jgi:hypothetical protein
MMIQILASPGLDLGMSWVASEQACVRNSRLSRLFIGHQMSIVHEHLQFHRAAVTFRAPLLVHWWYGEFHAGGCWQVAMSDRLRRSDRQSAQWTTTVRR